jgi:hypothetical protein
MVMRPATGIGEYEVTPGYFVYLPQTIPPSWFVSTRIWGFGARMPRAAVNQGLTPAPLPRERGKFRVYYDLLL